MLMFSGLETQSEINQLLDKLFGILDRASLNVAGVDASTAPYEQEERRESTGCVALLAV